ncbi:MAG: hypothetical protein V2A66_00100 [Pseudomonadota bacterium]
MKKFISPFQIFICAFAPFVAGAFIHDFSGSAGVTWIAVLVFLAVGTVFLYRGLAFHRQAQRTFLFFLVFSLILSLLGSYFALMLEGLDSFKAIQAFETTAYHKSDLISMGDAAARFQAMYEDSGLIEALQYPWVVSAHYNNLLSPYKFGFALVSMPGIGYYSFAILAWWFGVTFYAVALHIYNLSGDGQRKNFFLAGMIAWFILPFALPYDREAIAVVAMCLVALGIVSPYRLSLLDWLSIAMSMWLIAIHRPVYIPLVFALAVIFISCKLRIGFLLKRFQSMSKRGALLWFLGMLFVSAFLVHISAFFSSFSTIAANNIEVFQLAASEQDLWQQFRVGIPVFDDLVKLFFLVLSPFPFYQMFKDGDEFALIVPAVLISLNVFPVFMIGKLFVVVSIVKKILSGATCCPVLFLISLMFILPALSGMRTGAYYLIPSLSILVLWLLRNGLDTQFVKRSFVTYISIVCIAHFLYILVYRKL